MLLEELTGYQPSISPEKLDVIEHQCQPFIKKIGGIDNLTKYPIFRGINSPNKLTTLSPGLYVGTMKSNRKPHSTPIKYHNFINQLFIDKFNTPYRNGVFATGKSDNATLYGKIYQFIPIGDFSYCWSPDVWDLYSVLEHRFHEHEFEKDDLTDISESNQKYLRELVNTYMETNLLDAIKTKHEIMFWCHNYLLVS